MRNKNKLRTLSLLPHTLLGFAALAVSAAGVHAQNLRPDMRTWTVTPSHASIQVTQTSDEITWSSCQCGNVAVACKVNWTVPATGLYMMTTRTLNYDTSGTDWWQIGARSNRPGEGFVRTWAEQSGLMADFPQAIGTLSKGDVVELFVDGRASTFGGRKLAVDLVRVEAPVFAGLKWASFLKTGFDAKITPRSAKGQLWLFFASPSRLATAVPIPGVGGPGLWLTTPTWIMSQTTTDVRVEFPVSIRRWPTLHWQVLELELTPQGAVFSIGSPNELFSV